jgi:hypothetical protein
VSQDTIEPLAHPCLLQLYSQRTSFRNSPDALQLMNELKMWDMKTMKYYLDKKKNEITLLTGKLIELEIIKLSEVSQAQRNKGCMFSVIYGN